LAACFGSVDPRYLEIFPGLAIKLVRWLAPLDHDVESLKANLVR
jgi:hypothetical protein